MRCPLPLLPREAVQCHASSPPRARSVLDDLDLDARGDAACHYLGVGPLAVCPPRLSEEWKTKDTRSELVASPILMSIFKAIIVLFYASWWRYTLTLCFMVKRLRTFSIPLTESLVFCVDN